MITVICGEDNSSSRLYFAGEIANFKSKGFEVKSIVSEELKFLESGYIDKTLFGSKTIYINENIHKAFSHNKNVLNTLLNTLSKNKDLIILIWEDSISKRDLGVTAAVTFKEFRPDKNIFKLIESCYPSNLKAFINTMNEIRTKTNDFFVFIMLSRHIKKLILYQHGIKPPNLQTWQEIKLSNQEKYWKSDLIIDYYDKLISIDYLIKTGKSPYKIFDYIETLSTYYL